MCQLDIPTPLGDPKTYLVAASSANQVHEVFALSWAYPLGLRLPLFTNCLEEVFSETHNQDHGLLRAVHPALNIELM